MIWKRTFTIIIVFLMTTALTSLASYSERIKPNKSFKEFPMEIGQWQGKSSRLDQDVYNILGVEDYIMANYWKPAGGSVNLYVGFYQSQKQGDIIHSPKNCMPGAGWNIAKSSVIPIELTKSNKKIKVIKLLLVKGDQKQVVLYWFQSRGRIIASEYMQKIWLVIDSIIKNRTDGSFVRLISPVTIDEETAVDFLTEFADGAYPILSEYIPS